LGRVLRLGDAHKKFGLCVVPVYSNVGIATEKSLNGIVDAVFGRGEMVDSVVKKINCPPGSSL